MEYSRVSGLFIALLLATACGENYDRGLRISIVDGKGPVSGVHVSVFDPDSGAVLQAGTTGADGHFLFERLSSSELVFEALYVGDERAAFLTRSVDAECAKIDLFLGSDFDLGPVIRAEYSEGERPASNPRIVYGLPELNQPRKVEVVLEIDYIEGIQRRELAAPTRAGVLTIEEVFADAGLRLEVVWDEALPAHILGDDLWPAEAMLTSIMEGYCSLDPGPERWHLYLLLLPLRQPGTKLSLVIDPASRAGAVVLLEPTGVHPGEDLHSVIHELGHLLNLPHPWELTGSSRSAMTYPWRWSDWDWDDASVFHFDGVGRHHLLHAPEPYVRPGGSRFLDYGLPEESPERDPDGCRWVPGLTN